MTGTMKSKSAEALPSPARMKPGPDPSKLWRWSDRLISAGAELGMRVVASDIGQMLARILGISL
jgi:hypothetical protein